MLQEIRNPVASSMGNGGFAAPCADGVRVFVAGNRAMGSALRLRVFGVEDRGLLEEEEREIHCSPIVT